jgi:regulatory protein
LTVSETIAAALRLLSRQSRSEQDLATRLLRKGFAPADVDAALLRCRQLGYLDDERFALERSRRLLREGKAVGWRLQADLRQRGIPEQLAHSAAEAAGRELSPREILATLLTRRFPAFDYQRATDKEKRRVLDYLLRRGFSLGSILSYFQNREDDCCHHDDR